MSNLIGPFLNEGGIHTYIPFYVLLYDLRNEKRVLVGVWNEKVHIRDVLPPGYPFLPMCEFLLGGKPTSFGVRLECV